MFFFQNMILFDIMHATVLFGNTKINQFRINITFEGVHYDCRGESLPLKGRELTFEGLHYDCRGESLPLMGCTMTAGGRAYL